MTVGGGVGVEDGRQWEWEWEWEWEVEGAAAKVKSEGRRRGGRGSRNRKGSVACRLRGGGHGFKGGASDYSPRSGNSRAQRIGGELRVNHRLNLFGIGRKRGRRGEREVIISSMSPLPF